MAGQQQSIFLLVCIFGLSSLVMASFYLWTQTHQSCTSLHAKFDRSYKLQQKDRLNKAFYSSDDAVERDQARDVELTPATTTTAAAATAASKNGIAVINNAWRERFYRRQTRVEVADRASRRVDGNEPAYFWYEPTYSCELSMRYSDAMRDGAKWICNPQWLTPDEECIILSFGIGLSADFENALYNHDVFPVKHCKILAFDPSNYAHSKSIQMLMDNGVKIERTGISAAPGSVDGRPTKTYRQHLVDNNLLDKRITMFKIDVEGAEWGVFKNMHEQGCDLFNKIDMILVEFHHAGEGTNSNAQRYRQTMDGILKCGFRVYSREGNPYNTCCAELAFVHRDYIKRGYKKENDLEALKEFQISLDNNL